MVMCQIGNFNDITTTTKYGMQEVRHRRDDGPLENFFDGESGVHFRNRQLRGERRDLRRTA
jgi:hypothetical protein